MPTLALLSFAFLPVGGDPPTASAVFDIEWAACKDGDGRECFHLGARLLSIEEHVGWMQVLEVFGGACRGGELAGCLLGVQMVIDRKGQAVLGDDRVANVVRRTCEAGDAGACAAVGQLLMTGAGGFPSNPVGALAAFERACGLRSRAGCHWLKLALDSAGHDDLGSLPSRWRVQPWALALLEAPLVAVHDLDSRDVEHRSDEVRAAIHGMACDHNLVEACRLVPVTPTARTKTARTQAIRAMRRAERGCRAGDERSCVSVGWRLLSGSRRKHDWLRGAAVLEGSCARGIGHACALVGGQWVENERTRAVLDRPATPWLEHGCAMGDGPSCHYLGQVQRTGIGGTAPSPIAAARSYERACVRDVPSACAALGEMYRDGYPGTPPNPDAAAALFADACRLGQPASCPGRRTGP